MICFCIEDKEAKIFFNGTRAMSLIETMNERGFRILDLEYPVCKVELNARKNISQLIRPHIQSFPFIQVYTGERQIRLG